MRPPEYDDIIKLIIRIPEEWDGKSKEIHFKIITYREDAVWVSSRIYEEVDRDLISTRINAKSSKYSVELEVIITIVGGLVAKKAVDILLEELRNYLIKKWEIHNRRKRKIKELRG